VYFTVGVDGALFGAGDFHAAMGDGEIVVCGAETPGELRFKAEVVEGLKGLPTPFVETADKVATIYSAATIDEASNGAIHRMAGSDRLRRPAIERRRYADVGSRGAEVLPGG
jgi:amidase